jgi:hypothetical protein
VCKYREPSPTTPGGGWSTKSTHTSAAGTLALADAEGDTEGLGDPEAPVDVEGVEEAEREEDRDGEGDAEGASALDALGEGLGEAEAGLPGLGEALGDVVGEAVTEAACCVIRGRCVSVCECV